MVHIALQNAWILHRVNKEVSDSTYSLFASRREVVNPSIHLRTLAKETLVILQSKAYHPMSDLMMLDTIRYPQRSKVDARSVKRIQGVVVLSARLIYMTNVLKFSMGIRHL